MEEDDDGAAAVAAAETAAEAGGVPDFSQFLEDDGDREAESDSCCKEQMEMAQVVLELLVFQQPQRMEPRAGRRLLFQGGFVDGALIQQQEQQGNRQQEQEQPALFSNAKTFLRKAKAQLKSDKRRSSSASNELQRYGRVADFLKLKKDRKAPRPKDMVQSFLFDDFLVLAKPKLSGKGLQVLFEIELKSLTVRDMGSGCFIMEDDEDETESPTEEQQREVEAHEKQLLEAADTCVEILDMESSVRLVLDAGGASHRAVWLDHIFKAVCRALRRKNPMIATNPGWRHGVLRGTIWSAALEGNVYQMGCALRRGTNNVDDGDQDDGFTPMHLAAIKDHSIIARQLLAAGANVDVLSNELQTPLHLAASYSSLATARVLLNAECDPNIRDLRDETPVFAAVTACRTSHPMGPEKKRLAEIILLLGSSGADCNIENVDGHSPLGISVSRDEARLVPALLEAGAKPDMRFRTSGYTTLLLLCDALVPNISMIAKMLFYGADPNARDPQHGNTALHILALHPDHASAGAEATLKIRTQDQRDAIQLLVSFGARTDIPNKKGDTVDVILAKHNIDVAEAVSQWKLRQEPQGIEGFAQAFPHRMPVAVDQNSSAWQQDAEAPECRSCGQAFSLLNRRRHCRRCGQIFCGACSSKAFTLRFLEPDDGMRRDKVCDACFNNLSRSLRVAVADSKLVQESAHEHLADARAQLFGDQQRQAERDKQKPGVMASTVSSAQQSLQQAHLALQERGEKLGILADKSAAMSDNASNFSMMARRLAEREEKKAGWFNFFT